MTSLHIFIRYIFLRTFVAAPKKSLGIIFVPRWRSSREGLITFSCFCSFLSTSMESDLESKQAKKDRFIKKER